MTEDSWVRDPIDAVFGAFVWRYIFGYTLLLLVTYALGLLLIRLGAHWGSGAIVTTLRVFGEIAVAYAALKIALKRNYGNFRIVIEPRNQP